jgi:hypothetical protein
MKEKGNLASDSASDLSLLLSFGVATVPGWVASLWVVFGIWEQAVHSEKPLLSLLPLPFMLMLIYGLTSLLGLSLLRGQPNGRRLWRRGVFGFVAGAGLSGLVNIVGTLYSRSLDLPDVVGFLSGASPGASQGASPFWLPPLGGIIAWKKYSDILRKTKDLGTAP